MDIILLGPKPLISGVRQSGSSPPTGDGIVRLDLITAKAAHRLITALTRGLCHELEHLPVSDQKQGRSSSSPLGPSRS